MVKLKRDAEIALTPDEIALAEHIGQLRDQQYQGKHKPGLCNGRDGTLGVLGELAFCKLINAYPLALDVTECGPVDALWGKYRIDVKTKSHNDPELWVYPGSANRGGVDGYVLMNTLDGQNFTYKGRVSHTAVLDKPTEQRPGCTPAHIFKVLELIE